MRRLDEVKRTCYIGNLNPMITEEHICQLFSVCGNILYLKMAGEIGQQARFAFIEFNTVEAAHKAYELSGTVLLDREIRVGPSNVRRFLFYLFLQNPIVKTTTSLVYNPLPSKQAEIARKLKTAQDALEKRKRQELGLPPRKHSLSPDLEKPRDRRDRSKDRRDRSRDRRDRSRDRDRRRY